MTLPWATDQRKPRGASGNMQNWFSLLFGWMFGAVTGAMNGLQFSGSRRAGQTSPALEGMDYNVTKGHARKKTGPRML